MNLLQFFQSKNKFFYISLFFLGLVRSLTNICLLMVIASSLGRKSVADFGHYNYLVYIFLMFLSFICTKFFQNRMVTFNNEVVFHMEISLIQKARKASFESFDKLGYQKIYSALGDARSLGRIPEVFITLVNSFITIACSLVYLFMTSVWGGVAVLVLMAFLLTVYLYRDARIRKDMNLVRDLQDQYYEALREFLVGFKQIRISQLRNNNLFKNYILRNKLDAKDLNIKIAKQYFVNELTGMYSWYVLLGVVIFVLPPFFGIGTVQMATFITCILFMIGPVSQLVMFFPTYNSFKIAIERITKINTALQENACNIPEDKWSVEDFRTIRFENVVYRYGDTGDDSPFVVEMPDLTITNGETLFITGGNGSGKTTFVNILTGLCTPEQGKVFIDDREFSWEEFTRFCNSMAVVFTDHVVFKNNYDKHNFSEHNPEFIYLRRLLNLEGILLVKEEGSKVDNRLSKGQQKRLALLLALLENKPILILDEWAAEQDPYNRRYFYREVLEIIKGMNKTVIAISHDDDFYHVADRVLRFNYGRIVSDSRAAEKTL
jgi:ABC-type siderophore export system fused ATPase/permease subunit